MEATEEQQLLERIRQVGTAEYQQAPLCGRDYAQFALAGAGFPLLLSLVGLLAV